MLLVKLNRLLTRLISSIFIVVGSSIISQAFATELMTWQRLPLNILLHLNQERVIFVDKNVSVGYPTALDGKVRIQSAGGAVYLTAYEPFSGRVQLKDNHSGDIILVDLHVEEGNLPLEPVKIVSANSQKQTENEISLPQNANSDSSVIPIKLTRYAAQSLYAPLRAIAPVKGVRKIPVRLPVVLDTLLPQQPVNSSPLGAWQLGRYIVTAIRIQNRSSQTVYLDPRELQGQFYSAAFQHNWIGRTGSAEDTTTVYLVTKDKPLAQALFMVR